VALVTLGPHHFLGPLADHYRGQLPSALSRELLFVRKRTRWIAAALPLVGLTVASACVPDTSVGMSPAAVGSSPVVDEGSTLPTTPTPTTPTNIAQKSPTGHASRQPILEPSSERTGTGAVAGAQSTDGGPLSSSSEMLGSAPSAVATTTGPLFGASVLGGGGDTYLEALRKADSRYGGMDVVRVFYLGKPSAWASMVAAEGRPVVVSFGYHPRDVLAGRADAYLRDWFANAPTTRDTYWVYSHEPEDDVARRAFTAADYRAAWRRIRGLADRATNPRLKATLVLMCWTFNSKSGRNWRDYYAGSDVIQLLAFDCYNWMARKGGYAAPENVYGNAVRTAKSLGIPFGIAETGSLRVPGDDGRQRAAWLRSVSSWLTLQNARFVAYFDIMLKQSADYRLRDSYSITAWRQYCS